MQSYNSAVDGKTLIRVGGGHGLKVQTAQSNATFYTVKSDLGLPMTSSRRSSLTSSSPVTITSSTISIGDIPVPGVGSTSGTVTVKTAIPQKKMTSIIDTKSGVVTSSFQTVDPVTSPAATATLPHSAPPSPMINYGPVTPGGDAKMTMANRRASTSSAKSTSVLMTSTTIPATSLGFEETSSSVLMTSSIPMLAPSDVTSSNSTSMTSPAPNRASSILIASIPTTTSRSHVTSNVDMATPTESRNLVVAVAEVHSPPTGVNSENGLDNEERGSSLSLPYPAGSSRSQVMNPSDEANSLVSTDEVDVQVYVGTNMADGVQLPVPDPTEGNPLPASDEKLCDLNSNPTSPQVSSSPSSLPPLSPPLNQLISPPAPINPPLEPPLNPPLDPSPKPRSYAGSLINATKSNDEISVIAGSGSEQEDSVEKKPASTFSFIGWEVASVADKATDRNCHRVLIFKDSEIALMFKASCPSEAAGYDPRLTDLMVDIATNCAKRLKKMKDIITLPKLQAEHMDSLPLTDERPTRQHLEEISRDLNENVMINDIAFRFQSTEEDSYIGTYVDESDVRSTESNCQIGRSAVIVVLKRKSRFATVESFSDQLCRHILAARPSSLGRISDLELRRLSSTKTPPDPEKNRLLLFQAFLSDPSIIVAEAARRSFLRIEDFLFFA